MSNPWVLIVVNVGALAFVILFAIWYGRRQERKAHARRIHPAAQAPAERDASLLFLRKEAGRPCEYGDAVFSCSDFIGLWQQWCGPCLALNVLRDMFPESSPSRADSAPRVGAAHPEPSSRDGAAGPGCASNP